MLAEGKAYRCFCTPEELEAERKQAAAEHRQQIYSRRCLAIPAAESAARAASGEHFAVRLEIPNRPLRFHDIVRGDVEFAADSVSDPVLVRSASGASAGVPVYNYVVTVDDALMEITHVIRGDDHISNTPKQVAIYEAFGWKVPEFAHLSTILGADRERLSKRHGATSIASFREMGILPEALVNYLALLGWGAEGGLRETFTPDELIKEFKIERVTASPAVFDFDKLNWLNRHYLKLADPARLTELAWPYFVAANLLPTHSYCGVSAWFTRLHCRSFVPAVDRLDQLDRARAASSSAMTPCSRRRPTPRTRTLIGNGELAESPRRARRACKSKFSASHGRAIQSMDERNQNRNRSERQRAISSSKNRPDRLPLRPRIRQAHPADRRGKHAQPAGTYPQRARAGPPLCQVRNLSDLS